MEKFATLQTTSRPTSPDRKASNSRWRSLTGVSPLMTGASRASAELVELVEVLPDHQGRLAGVPGDELLDHGQLLGRARREPVALLGLRGRVDEPLVGRQRHPHLDAVGRRDPALRLDVLPRRVVPLRPDQREHVALAAVLAHQRRGQPDPAPGLEVGGHPEDRRRQQVHLVVDDQPPVAGVEQLEVAVDAGALGGHHLVRRDGDRPDLLDRAGVLADLVGRQRRTPDELVLPLPGRHRVGDQDQRGRLGVRHRGRADQRLAGAAREHDHAATRRARTTRRRRAGSRAGATRSRRARSGAPRRRRSRRSPRPASRS